MFKAKENLKSTVSYDMYKRDVVRNLKILQHQVKVLYIVL